MEPRAPSIDELRIRAHPRGWALLVDDLEEPAWVVSTKQKALAAGRKAARFHDARLVVHARSGEVQRVIDPPMS